jgi:small subunit ribosomal protein S9
MADEDQTPTPDGADAPDAPDAPEAAAEETQEQSAEASAQDAAADAPQDGGPEADAPADPAVEPAPEPAAEPAPEPAEVPVVEPVAQAPAAEPEAEGSSEAAGADAGEAAGDSEGEPAPRVKPAVPGAHLEVDIVPEGVDPLGRGEEYVDPYAIDDEEDVAGAVEDSDRQDESLSEPIATAAIDLAAGARYRATGKRKTAIARVTLRPGSGTYLVNGRSLEEHFPRATLQRNIRQPLETVGYQERMDVVARLHGGGISAQAGALRHGVSRALLEADPNLRGELKRRGFLTRDSRAKERKKAGLKKARKRPQFSKR